jgi:hypothetical protein
MRGWVLTKRSFAIAAVAVTVYVMVGCALFADWWYRFLWDGKFNWYYVADGLKFLLDDYFPLSIGIVLTVCVVFALGSVFNARLFRYVDKFAGRIALAAVLLLFPTALIMYHTEKPLHDLLHATELNLMTMDNIQSFLAASNSPPHILPPVDFHYIDKNRVDELYNQIEPDLIEKERTVAKTTSAKGKVGVGVSAATAEAEAGKSESSTSSFARATFSTERKGVELMNYVVNNRAPKYYTNSRGWFLGRENAALALQMEKEKNAPVDWSKLKPIKPVSDSVIGGDPPSEEEKREAERKAKQYQSELFGQLESLGGYVFVAGEFDLTLNGDALMLAETFSVKPRRVVFRIYVPKSQMTEFQNQSRLRLSVFGDTTRPLSSDGYVDVRPIAIY